MSLSPGVLRAPGGGADGGGLFRHEARRDSKVVAVLEGTRQSDGSVVVEATVVSVGKSAKRQQSPVRSPSLMQRRPDASPTRRSRRSSTSAARS